MNKLARLSFAILASIVTALIVIALVLQPIRAAGPWYVAPSGSDSNTCLSPAQACASISGALSRPDFVAGDTIRVAVGVYTGTGAGVVVLYRNAAVSGGWNTTFTTQGGMSTLDAQRTRQGIIVNNGITAFAERFVIQNGTSDSYAGGILNNGMLTLDHIIVTNNSGGISNNGNLVLNNSTVANNNSGFLPGGISNKGTMTLNNSTVNGNSGAGGGIGNNGTLTLNSSTVSGNHAGPYGGGGILNFYGTTGTVTLNSSTISGNTAAGGGGFSNAYGYPVILQNTVLAGNTALFAGPDCSGSIGSAGYNLVGDVADCTFIASTGDVTDVVPLLGLLMGPPETPQYHPLLSGSPAINSGNPGGCTGSTGPLTSDQRGVARVGRCDIGAYEYTTPGLPISIYAFAGTPQHTLPLGKFDSRLQAAVLDGIGSPVSGVTVTFAAPASGASGTFTDTGSFTTTPFTNLSGIATAEVFVANELAGTYPVTATVGGVQTSASFILSNILWYVTPAGSDNNDCVHSTAACATISGVLGKLEFLPGDTVLVAVGIYTSTAGEGVWLGKDVILSGGWDISFTTQLGQSTIDGQGTRRGITVDSGAKVVLDRFHIQNGKDDNGAGIWNGGGDLTVTHSMIDNNAAGHMGWSGYGGGGGILNGNGRVVLIDSAITSNTLAGGFNGSGIFNGGTTTIDNSTISSNTGPNAVYNEFGGSLTLNNATIFTNSSIGIYGRGATYLRNTIAAGNATDCYRDLNYPGPVTSLGYNLVQNNSGCDLVDTDQTGIDPKLDSLQGLPAFYPLRLGSTAINRGNPAGCMGSTGLLASDQRGMPRVGRCDIGSFEYPGVVFQALLALVVRNYAAPCPPLYADNFSNSNSGWPTGDNSYVLREYLNGEYHIRVKDFDWWAGSTPGASFSDFIASVDITNANITNGSFGVIFGLSPSDWSQLYSYEIETVPSGRYGIYKYSAGSWTTLAEGSSSSISTREARNHIAVERNGSLIKAYANGQMLTSVSDSSYVGMRRLGLIVTSFNQSPVDVRFDNFGVFAPGCSANTAAPNLAGSTSNAINRLHGQMDGPRVRGR